MYSNYLTEVGKLVFILGDIQATSAFKKTLDSYDHKSKIFFKCLDELPVNSYKKVKLQARRKGILRCDWFNKILDRSPMMIFMVFNYTQPLDKNQKWEDRLSLTIRKVNKVVDILRSSNKEDIILRIIVIISKQAVVHSNNAQNSVNIVEKITSFLKTYERDLHIFQSDILNKQIQKNKTNWFTMLDKAYQRKHRSIAKRKQQSYSQRRIGCIIKMAIISEIISKKDSYHQYDDAYKAIHFRFMEIMKSRIDPFNFDPVRQLRTIADIILLRMLIVKIHVTNNYTVIPETIANHLKFFTQKDCNHYFFLYQNLIWRQNFMQNLLEITHIYDHIQFIPKNYFLQLINGVIDLSYKLSESHSQISNKLEMQEVKGRLIPIDQSVYIGSKNYTTGIQINDVDIVWTQMSQLVQMRKDYITRGTQNITRYKTMKKFNKNELCFLNTYLMRFFIADDKCGSAQALFNILTTDKLQKLDYYFLNGLLNEIKGKKDQLTNQLLKIYGVAILLADYYKNENQLNHYGQLLVEQCHRLKKTTKKKSVDLLEQQITEQASQNLDDHQVVYDIPVILLPLNNNSNIFRLQINFPSKLHPIQQKMLLIIKPYTDNKFATILSKLSKTFLLEVVFNHQQLNLTKQIQYDNSDSNIKDIQIQIDPLKYFRKDQLLCVKGAILKNKQFPFICFFISSISYSKYQNVTFYTKLQIPQVSIRLPYQTYFLNEVSKLTIDIGRIHDSVSIDTTFTVITDLQKQTVTTQIYTDYSNKMNLTNSKIYQKLNTEQKTNIVYMKCSKLGINIIKFLFIINITQNIGDKILKNTYNLQKQVGFKVIKLFKTLKICKQSYTGNQLKLTQIPTNKKIILSYSLRAEHMINIKQLDQHSSPKNCVKMYKKIQKIEDMILQPEQKLKNIVIFEVIEDLIDKKQMKHQIFIVSFYIKWNRIDMDMKLAISDDSHPCDNTFVDEQLKVFLKPDQVQVQFQEGVQLKKCKKQGLQIKYRNLTNKSISIYAIMQNSQSILRVGGRHQSMTLGPKQIKKLIFDVLPIKSGYHTYPDVKNFFDGIQASQKACNTYLCVM